MFPASFVVAAGLFLVGQVGTDSEPVTTPSARPTAAMIDGVLQGVVELRAQGPEGLSSGSGFLIASDGKIVTNVHILRGATQLGVRLRSGEVFDQVSILAFDPARDIAIIKISGFNLPTLELGDSDQVQPGDTVFVVGNPRGLENTVTKGIISSVRVKDDGVKVIQTDAAASPGNSGGPLLGETGQVFGVISFKIAGESLNFAIPINYVRGLETGGVALSLSDFNRLLASGSKSLFGDAAEGVTPAGRWRSLASNSIKVLRQDGDYLTGEALDPRGQSVATYDLSRRQDGTYSGKARSELNCSYWSIWAFPYPEWLENHCRQEFDVEFTKVSPNRIEGRVRSPQAPPGPNKTRKWADYCHSCGQSASLSWETFSWVRAE